MARHRTRNPRLQDRDREILEHVRRYGLSTPDVLKRLFFDTLSPDGEIVEEASPNAVVKVTSRLTKLEFLTKHPLFGSNQYFTLGMRGAKSVGLSRKSCQPFGPDALRARIGILKFCCFGAMRHERITVEDITRGEPFPGLISPRAYNCSYYLDVDADDAGGPIERLGFAWVVAGQPASAILQKIEQDIILPRATIPTVRRLMEDGRFVVAVIVPTEAYRQQVVSSLQTFHSHAKFRVAVVSDLIHLPFERRHD